MKNQLTELLTKYGEIGGIWFDGYWDQTAPEGAADRSPRLDWHLGEIYALIHKLQPQCLIGNNHHLTPFEGEDFQMFERDLPGENKSGLSYQKPSAMMPLETCETINGSWGFNITDTAYKTHEQLVHYLVKAGGLGANFLLNIGPMPNGEVQPEFKERLAYMGAWLKTYGESVYNTTAGYMHPQDWGCITQRPGKMYVHLFAKDNGQVTLQNFPYKAVTKAYLLKNSAAVHADVSGGAATVSSIPPHDGEPDEVIVLETSNG
jgi:alpha-L-fucosidase